MKISGNASYTLIYRYTFFLTLYQSHILVFYENSTSTILENHKLLHFLPELTFSVKVYRLWLILSFPTWKVFLYLVYFNQIITQFKKLNWLISRSVFLYRFLHTHTHTHTHAHTHTHTQKHPLYIYTHPPTHTHIYIYIYISLCNELKKCVKS